MSLRVKSLNADSSFLLIFSPPAATHDPQGTFPGSFTVLIDPWLSGSSTIYHRKFANTDRTVPSCVESLDALPDPDIVIVSQDQPDHCHRETLLTLPPDTAAGIFTTPAAARKIRSWKHFDPARVRAMPRYDERAPNKSVVRIPIPAYSHAGQPGEVTIAYLCPKPDLTGLHNAFGITYRPPSSPISARNASYLDLSPPSPPITPLGCDGTHENPLDVRYNGRLFGNGHGLNGQSTPPTTPPSVSTLSTSSLSNHSSLDSAATYISAPFSADTTSLSRERAISVIYSPHGLLYSLIKPYVSSHLLTQGALPLTALFHSLDRIDNPWYLGGRIIDGGTGGAQIAKATNARVWISAHDEEKVTSGWSVARMKCTQMDTGVARDLLRRYSGDNLQKSARCTTEIIDMDSGEELFLKS